MPDVKHTKTLYGITSLILICNFVLFLSCSYMYVAYQGIIEESKNDYLVLEIAFKEIEDTQINKGSVLALMKGNVDLSENSSSTYLAFGIITFGNFLLSMIMLLKMRNSYVTQKTI